jgi:radical SAM superfamily enzyme YgiQ (UPF0313 family)
VDNMNVLFLTPLPGTRLWKQLEAEKRIAMDAFPEDWKYYTLNYPVAHYKYLTRDVVIREMNECNSTFYSTSNILSRMSRNLLAGRNPLFSLVSNLTSRRNSTRFADLYEDLWQAGASTEEVGSLDGARPDLVDLWGASAQQVRRVGALLKLQIGGFFRQS